MKQNNKYISITIALVLIVAFIAVYMGKHSQKDANPTGTTTAITTDTNNTDIPSTAKPSLPTKKPTVPSAGLVITGGDTTGFNAYSNGTYNFSIKYPKYVKQQSSFDSFHELTNNWRIFASPANSGKQVTSFSIYTIDQGSLVTGKEMYPLYFNAEVRIGASTNVRDCYDVDPAYPNQKVTDVVINGTPFKKFSVTDTAMMKYVQVESYRTIHNNTCFALEQVKVGTSYRDEKMKPGLSDQALNDYYTTGETIIKTFKFTK